MPAEDFRTAFFADKLLPYHELACLCERDGRIPAAFGFVEQARARALSEQIGAPRLSALAVPSDEFTAQAQTRLAELREELNWFYSRINRPGAADTARLVALQQAARERERETLEITRRLEHREHAASAGGPPDLAGLAAALGTGAALISYTLRAGRWHAFVVTNEGIAVRGLGSVEAVNTALAQFDFQIGALRYGAGRLRAHLPQLTQRTQSILAALYDLLLRPLLPLAGARRLVIVPQGVLHYVPFHALYDGANYVIEQRAVSYAPSAAIFCQCAAVPLCPLHNALLCGVPDAQTPRVGDEIKTLIPLFAESTVLLGAEATLAAVRACAPLADVLHLACHGHFRPDNPLFSAVQLADGWLTVRDAAALHLRASLVTLSACETGVNAVAPGDEIMGLARGFFTAGVPSLVLSRWAVDDAATADLMAEFYRSLQSGLSPAEALRAAQCATLKQQPHPFFWSPFILLGR